MVCCIPRPQYSDPFGEGARGSERGRPPQVSTVMLIVVMTTFGLGGTFGVTARPPARPPATSTMAPAYRIN